eukprot:scaffold120140_cov74-Attheya_sp.AAC.3
MELPNELVFLILTLCDVPTLVQKKCVCHFWQRICTVIVDQKVPIPRKQFQTRDELRTAVKKYARYEVNDADAFATTYGWPIDTWDVSKVKDFSRVFAKNHTFNEP